MELKGIGQDSLRSTDPVARCIARVHPADKKTPFLHRISKQTQHNTSIFHRKPFKTHGEGKKNKSSVLREAGGIVQSNF
jgi:hypothetical protein